MTWITDGKWKWESALTGLNVDINYTGPEYGILHSNGLWNGLNLPSTALTIVGITTPPERDANTGLLLFSDGVVEALCGSTQMPQGWKAGTNIEATIQVMVSSATNPTEDANTTTWLMQAQVSNVNSEWDQASYSYSESVYFGHSVFSVSPRLERIEFPALDMTSATAGSCIFWRIARLGTDTNDNYPNDIWLAELSFHYRVNKFGSIAMLGDNL